MSAAVGTADHEPSRFPPYAGITEIKATSSHEPLVLERGYDPEEGYSARVYEVSLRGARDISGGSVSSAPPLDKRLLVELGACPAGDARPADAGTPSTNPLLGNYEGLELGPELPGDRRLLLALKDDNYNTDSEAVEAKDPSRAETMPVPGLQHGSRSAATGRLPELCQHGTRPQHRVARPRRTSAGRVVRHLLGPVSRARGVAIAVTAAGRPIPNEASPRPA